MYREKECFRENIARISAIFPDKECLKKSDVRRVTGWNPRTIEKRLSFNKFGEITIADLARQLSV